MISPKQRAFLKAYSISGSVLKAAEAANVQRGMHYRWLEADEYVAAFAAARNELADALEAAAVQRALEGVLEPVFYKGKAIGAIRRYSDGNTQFLLRGLRPEVYRERVSAELTGKDGGPIPIKMNDLTRQLLRSPEALAAAESLFAALEAEPGGLGGAPKPG